MRKKGTKRKSASAGKLAEENAKLPPFFVIDEVRFLVRQVRAAAGNGVEHRSFMTVLRRAYEDVMELEALYPEIPGVLANDSDAIHTFREVLERAARRTRRSHGSVPRRKPRSVTPWHSHAPSDHLPVQLPLLKPFLFVLLAQALGRIAGNKDTYYRDIEVVRDLWSQSYYLERFYAEALSSVKDGETNRLADDLRLIVRATRPGMHSPMTGVSSGAVPPGFGDPGPGPDDGGRPDTFWPPPPDGDVVSWPPDDFVPEHPHDYDYIIEPCIDRAVAGLGEYHSAEASTYADGIASIEPQQICGPRQVTIRGSFPPLRPRNVDVLVGDVVATIVSWSADAIVIDVPAEAVTGCVGFIDRQLQQLTAGLEYQDRLRIDEIGRELSRCFGYHVSLQPTPQRSPKAPCIGVNALLIGPPVIRSFLANGASSLTVAPGTHIVLT